jgi:hypothetical protein
MQIARERGADEVASWILALQSDCFTCLGDLPRAVASAHESIELSEKIDSQVGLVLSRTYLARALAIQGDLREASALIRQVAETAGVGKPFQPEAQAVLALIELGLGDPDRARETARCALDAAESMELELGRYVALEALARISAEGDAHARRDAESLLALAEKQCKDAGFRHRLPEVFEIRAMLAATNGDSAGQVRELTRSRDLYAEMEAPLQVERVEALLRAAAG